MAGRGKAYNKIISKRGKKTKRSKAGKEKDRKPFGRGFSKSSFPR